VNPVLSLDFGPNAVWIVGPRMSWVFDEVCLI